jgi:hypothetical protein
MLQGVAPPICNTTPFNVGLTPHVSFSLSHSLSLCLYAASGIQRRGRYQTLELCFTRAYHDGLVASLRALKMAARKSTARVRRTSPLI